MDNIKIFDNFLPDYYFKQIQSVLMGEDFPWFYKDYVAYKDPNITEKNQFQFIHNFLDPKKGQSKQFDLIAPFNGLGKMYRIKANLRTRTLVPRRSYYHVDYPDMVTAIYYINTCNGYTKFKKSGKKIKSVANRMIVFDSNLEHAGWSQTDEKRRIVVNFNFTEHSEFNEAGVLEI
tara:strand:+ start:193 stop:720 length:528 start_codon:yes stop_codon:yes gene_type:complete